MKETQTRNIIRHMLTIGPITGLDALRLYGCFRLPARIAEIKKMGLIIYKRMVSVNGKRIAQYSAVQDD